MPMDSQQLATIALQNALVVPVEPEVKSAKTREKSLCGVRAKAETAKSADPSCYNAPATWEKPRRRLFDKVEMNNDQTNMVA